MFSPFFILAAVSPSRQRALRTLIVAHVLIAGLGAVAAGRSLEAAAIIGNMLLVLGIVEGALVLGWRLTQLPKSQALEFLLVSPLRPALVFTAEALVGMARLALVTLSGLPALLFMVSEGIIIPEDLGPLLIAPLAWGTVTGLGLTAWAYEPAGVRRWGERLLFAGVIFYLLVGVLAGEHLRTWLRWLPGDVGGGLLHAFRAMHEYNPFGAMKFYFENSPFRGGPRLWWVQFGALVAIVLLMARAAARLHGHFHDRHYRPIADLRGSRRGAIGDRPLSWWAVRRVTEYSGRINVWLAAGFAGLYGAYSLAGPHWPGWLGKAVFVVFDRAGGIPTLVTALVLLSAVPAAFQYGLWDSSAQDRCRRLELLLLTSLDGHDYWHAAAAAAWRRGRGYAGVAALLLACGALAGQLAAEQALGMLAAGVILWGLYFALGFRAFARGMQANTLGLALTVGLPVLTFWLYRNDRSWLAWLTPPGNVYLPGAGNWSSMFLPGAALAAVTALLISRFAIAGAQAQLRQWYDRNHGVRVSGE